MISRQPAPDKPMKCLTLNLLLFSVGGVYFGVDADQVDAMTAYQGEMQENTPWFHEVMGYGNQTVTYKCPTVITVKTADYQMIIDSMEDIAEFSADDIRLLPPIVESFAVKRGIWGVLLRRKRMTLLLDLMCLPK